MKYNTPDNKLIYESIFDRQGHSNYKKPKVYIPTVSYILGENREAIYDFKLFLADNAYPWMMHKNPNSYGYIITLRASDGWGPPSKDTEEMISATHDPEWTLARDSEQWSGFDEDEINPPEKDLDPLYNFGLPFDDAGRSRRDRD